MPFTNIRMVVSMKSNRVLLTDHENNQQCEAPPFSAISHTLTIPWCDNADQFAQNHYMTIDCEGLGHPIAIWQSGSFVYWSANNNFPASGELGGNYQGNPYIVDGDHDVVLIVDNRPWPVAILYRLY